MKNIVRWAITNSPGMNTLVIGLIAIGAFCLMNLRREVFPEFELEVILISVPYPGADPDETESAICQKVEEAVSSIAGIKEITSIAQENLGSVVLEVDPGVPDVQKILNEVRSEVDRISTFPEGAEDAEVKQVTFRDTAIKLAVLGPEATSVQSQLRLREIAEQIREELVQLDTVTQAEIAGAKSYEIDVEIPEATLRRYGLSLADVSRTIRRENLDLPGGLLKSPSQDVLLKGENKRVLGKELEEIPLITDPTGVVLTIGDVASVRDGFADTTSITRINGIPAQIINVQKTSDEDLIQITDAVKAFAETAKLPPGYKLLPWDDHSVEVQDRINLLVKNGLQGLVLVFVTLALFLELRLAFWVAAGIPIAMLGACILLFLGGQTLNMLSLFSFLLVLGILVDDGIVIGENIHTHRQMGKSALRAAIDGTAEVVPSVFSSVATTVIAFVPLMFVAGVMGKFIAVLPIAVIACLLFSLVEASFVLPVHLAHEAEGGPLTRALASRRRMVPFWRWTVGTLMLLMAGLAWFVVAIFAPIAAILRWLNPICGRALDRFTEKLYAPALRWVLKFPALTICCSITILLLSTGLVAGGYVRAQFFPDLDNTRIQANITFPDGTPETVAEQAIARVRQSLQRVNEQYTKGGVAPVSIVQESVGYVAGAGTPGQVSQSTGSHLGQVFAELVDPSLRDVMSQQIVNAWRQETGEIAGTESITFESPSFGPAGRKIEFKLLASRQDADELEAVVEDVKTKLSGFAGTFDVDDDNRPGKAELNINLKPSAVALGVQRADLFENVRDAYFGNEVLRVQRGRFEVKIMARYPEEDRRSFADFEELRVRTAGADGQMVSRPITELAKVTVGSGSSEINRVHRQRSITVYCDVDETVTPAGEITAELKTVTLPEVLKEHPNIRVLWKGEAERRAESFNSMFVGMICAIIAMFGLLTVEFKSYIQPLLILMIVPFGIVGAILGHWFMGLPISFFSMMGLVALTGVVVNDSIVLVDFINAKLAEGLPLNEALYEAGVRRLRPVFLTSATTVAGLGPMLLETSFQAQILVPMAAALVFGLMMTTGLVLLLLPAVYSAYGSLVGLQRRPPNADEFAEPHALLPPEPLRLG